ncbi:MAG: hypothetical protein GXP26_16140 [Planctomycetes bacterium]|nr:hypothetical protein [Planctomycetota bacterium]
MGTPTQKLYQSLLAIPSARCLNDTQAGDTTGSNDPVEGVRQGNCSPCEGGANPYRKKIASASLGGSNSNLGAKRRL